MIHRYRIACLAIGLFLAGRVVASAVADGQLLLEVNIACGPARLQQQVFVAEGADFRVLTRTEGIAWTLSGHVGRVVDDTVEVALAIDAEDMHGASLTGVSPKPVKLKLNEYRPPATAHDRLATLGLWIHRDADVTPWLMQTISRRDDGWEFAVADLTKCGDQLTTVVPALVQLLDDTSLDDGRAAGESVRIAAAETLGLFGQASECAVAGLTRALNDDNPYVQLAAALALWEVKRNDASVRTVYKLVDHRDAHVRYRAARAVEMIAPGSSLAVDAPATLKELTHDGDGYVRLAAARALLAMARGDEELAVACLTELSKNAADIKLRRLAQHVLERKAARFRPDPLP